MQHSPFDAAALAGYRKENTCQASLRATRKPVKQMQDLCAGGQTCILTHDNTLTSGRTRVPIAPVKIVQPGQEREGNHAEQQRRHDGGIEVMGTQEYHHHDIG